MAVLMVRFHYKINAYIDMILAEQLEAVFVFAMAALSRAS